MTHNTYFDGKVQSLGLDTPKGRATIGVMEKGTYQFNTSTPEIIVVVSGIMNIKQPNAGWVKYAEHDEIRIPANIAFETVCDTDVAYICYYG
jgi:uncharacterized protein YaiE (UPF0345 family)